MRKHRAGKIKIDRYILTIILGALISSCNPIQDAKFQKAEIYTDQENYTAAIKIYDEIIGSDPENEKAYFERGNVRILIDDFQGVINDMDKVISFNPKSVEPYVNKAESLRMIDQNVEALSMLEHAIKNKTGVIAKSGKIMVAIENNYKNQYIENTNYDTRLEFILFERAMCYTNTGKYDEALVDLNYCVDNSEQFFQDIFLFERGNWLVHFGLLEEGCADLEKSMSLGNKEAEILFAEKCS